MAFPSTRIEKIPGLGGDHIRVILRCQGFDHVVTYTPAEWVEMVKLIRLLPATEGE